MTLIRFEKILEAGRGTQLAVSLASIVLALVLSGLVILAIGVNPVAAYSTLFSGAFGTLYGLSETLVKTTPLILCGLAVAVGLKMRLWNIGAEGQFVVGFLAATLIALRFPQLPALLLLPLLAITALIAAGVWAGIAGLLKARLGVSEIITTLLMNWVAILFSQYFAYGPLKGPDGFPYSPAFCTGACLPSIGWGRVNVGIFLALAVAVILYLVLQHTLWGFEVRVIGDSPKAARAAGMKIERNIVLVLALAGGLAGLAGFTEASGIEHRLSPHTALGYGYTAILVAWLARSHPLLVILVAFLFGGLYTGGEMIQVGMGVPVAVIRILQGAILFFLLAGDFLMNYRIRWGRADDR
jgi:ABC-type uncharacterized transport system permease subunit